MGVKWMWNSGIQGRKITKFNFMGSCVYCIWRDYL